MHGFSDEIITTMPYLCMDNQFAKATSKIPNDNKFDPTYAKG